MYDYDLRGAELSEMLDPFQVQQADAAKWINTLAVLFSEHVALRYERRSLTKDDPLYKTATEEMVRLEREVSLVQSMLSSLKHH